MLLFPTLCNREAIHSHNPYTISLKADHVKTLMEHGISAAHLDGGKKDFEVLPGLQSGKYRVLFVTPEKLFMQPYQHFITMASV